MAELDETYSGQMDSLQDAATNIGDANQGNDQRKWRQPEGWDGDPADVEAIQDGYDRSDLNETYQGSFDSGTAADAMSAKIQADYLAAQERAFRMRLASPIRCVMHAAGRRAGHGDSDSSVFARVSDHVEDIMVSGGS